MAQSTADPPANSAPALVAIAGGRGLAACFAGDVSVTGTLTSTATVAANLAASSSNASLVSAHTAEEIIRVVGVAAPGRPSAVAVALAVVADALKAEDQIPSPSRSAAGARCHVAARRTPSA